MYATGISLFNFSSNKVNDPRESAAMIIPSVQMTVIIKVPWGDSLFCDFKVVAQKRNKKIQMYLGRINVVLDNENNTFFFDRTPLNHPFSFLLCYGSPITSSFSFYLR